MWDDAFVWMLSVVGRDCRGISLHRTCAAIFLTPLLPFQGRWDSPDVK